MSSANQASADDSGVKSPLYPHATAPPTGSSVKDYLQSLESISCEIDHALVLPTHGLPFSGLSGRIVNLIEGHQKQLEKISRYCASPKKVSELITMLYGHTLQGSGKALAVAEILAVIEYLISINQVTSVVNEEGGYQFVSR